MTTKVNPSPITTATAEGPQVRTVFGDEMSTKYPHCTQANPETKKIEGFIRALGCEANPEVRVCVNIVYI